VQIQVGWQMAVLAMLLSFVLGMAVAWVYTATYQGLSYSRGFVQTIVLGGIVSCMVMMAIGNDVARGLGLVGALTIIRFRTTLKDTRDMVFAFASLGLGVACGVQAFAVAVAGAVVYSLVALYLGWSSFGSRRQFDAVIRFHIPPTSGADAAASALLRKHCAQFVLINLREASGGKLQEHSYHVKFARPERRAELVSELSRLPGLTDTSVEL